MTMKKMALGWLAVGWMAVSSAAAFADGMPETVEGPSPINKASAPAKARPPGKLSTASAEATPKQRSQRDPLAVDPQIAVKDSAATAMGLPGVMKLEGADADMLDATRMRKVFWRRNGTQVVWVSATQPNLIQLPFVNPRVISTQRMQIDKSASSNNVFVQFAEAPKPEQIWLMPAGPTSDVVGLQLVPKDIPAQYIVVVDDAVQSTASRVQRAGADNDYLTRVQALMEIAALGASPPGFSEAALQVPAMAVNGLAVEGLRRLSSLLEDLYVYQISNPGEQDREVREQEFDGPDVLAVSILPKPLLHPGERAILVVLAKKRQAK